MDVAINANAVIVERRLDRAIMSSSHGFWSLGGFFGGGAGGLVIDRIGAEAHSLIVSGVTMAMVLAAMPFLIGDPRPSAATATGQTPAGPAPARPRSGALYLLGMLAMFSLVPEGGVLDWAALYLTREYGASLSTASFGYAMFAGTMAVVRFLGDSVRNRFGAVATLRVSALIGAAGMIGAALAPDPWTAIACFGLSGLGIANLAPIIMSAAGNQPGATMGTGIALVATMAYTGLLFAPGVIGFAAEHVGYRVTYLVLAGLILVVAPLAGRVAAADRIGAVRPA
jgi:fucose permease